MKALIISSGNSLDTDYLTKLMKESDYTICADGGTNKVIKLDLKPDLIIGDLDSIDSKALKYVKHHGIPIERYPKEKDDSDTEIALKYLIDKGYKEITLVGVTGTRMDHTISSIFLLNRLLKNNIKGKIIDDNNEIYLIEDYIKLEKREQYYISVIPLTMEGIVITIRGCYYSLEEKHIEFNSTLGISNIIVDKFCEIIVHKGTAIVIESRD